MPLGTGHTLLLHRRRGAGGFTFVEILAALLFLGVVIPVIIGALAVANRASLLAERGAFAGELAENKLNEMLIDDAWTNAASTRGDFGADWTGYRWEVNTAEWTADNATRMTELDTDVFYTVQGREYRVRLSTLVDEANTGGIKP